MRGSTTFVKGQRLGGRNTVTKKTFEKATTPGEVSVCDAIAASMAEEFKGPNPAFDSDRFFAACGIR